MNIALDVDGKIGGAVSWDTHEYAEQGGRFWAAIDASPELHSGPWFKDADHIEAGALATESRPDSRVRIEAPLLDRQLTTKQDTYRQMEKLWIEIQRLMRENR